ncbi:hypothetical protein ACFOWU_07625 [Epilithonimonas zeae]|uniref:hypothetical protein n=1 Tax=Epilithonimonas zeae TaxID=1416779 RepID=UPI0011151343|nr:hypothetical protein [Epilithonimonas zeae]
MYCARQSNGGGDSYLRLMYFEKTGNTIPARASEWWKALTKNGTPQTHTNHNDKTSQVHKHRTLRRILHSVLFRFLPVAKKSLEVLILQSQRI